MVGDVEEVLEVVVKDRVVLECGFGFDGWVEVFVIVVVVVGEEVDEGVVGVLEWEKGVVEVVGGEEVVRVDDLVIMGVDG